ncbi:Diphthamide biosynthesis protein 2 [Batrachochytrium dendrobatidis]|nr:Diphthamide biosynthesis protein 2 [Batrachochytrium dendrobatidis]
MIDYHEKETIERQIETTLPCQSLQTTEQLLDTFEVQSTADLIVSLYKNKVCSDPTALSVVVAFQFPDSLLSYSSAVVEHLYAHIGKNIQCKVDLVVLADTTFGSCCVDTVAAEHACVDLIVHYGPSCLSRPASTFPVLVVLEKAPIDIPATVAYFISQFSLDLLQPVLVMYDLAYHHAAQHLAQALAAAGFIHLIWPHIETVYNMPKLDTNDIQHKPSVFKSDLAKYGDACIRETQGQKYILPEGVQIQDVTMFYIGDESLNLTNLMMTHSMCKQVIAYNPVLNTGSVQSGSANKLLMRRYFMVQKAKDADVIGIVVGTLGLASYLPVIENLKRLVLASGKKPYMLALGKPSPAKLGNFLEIDVFVLVACPQNALLETRDFLRPVVTPYELCIALDRNAEWDVSKYQLDLVTVDHQLSDTIHRIAERQMTRTNLDNGDGLDDSDDDQPHFSLVTGAYKQRKQYVSIVCSTDDEPTQGDSSALMARSRDNVISKYTSTSAAAEYLNNRTFQGLEAMVGQTTISDVQDGRRGIARGYINPNVEAKNDDSLDKS